MYNYLVRFKIIWFKIEQLGFRNLRKLQNKTKKI